MSWEQVWGNDAHVLFHYCSHEQEFQQEMSNRIQQPVARSYNFHWNSSLLLSLSRWKKDFDASYVDQQIAAAGAWNSILGIHPLISPRYPSFLTTVSMTYLIELLENLSQPETPCICKKNQILWLITFGFSLQKPHWKLTERQNVSYCIEELNLVP